MGRVTASTIACAIVEVILLLAAELARILGNHLDVVAKGVNAAGEVMGADAGLHADQAEDPCCVERRRPVTPLSCG